MKELNWIELGLPTPSSGKELCHRYTATRLIYHPSNSFLILTRLVLSLFTITSLLVIAVFSFKKNYSEFFLTFTYIAKHGLALLTWLTSIQLHTIKTSMTSSCVNPQEEKIAHADRKTGNQPWPWTHFYEQTCVLLRCENAEISLKKIPYIFMPMKTNMRN